MNFSKVENRGVTESGLKDLLWGLSKCNAEIAEHDMTYFRSREVVEILIKRLTSTHQCSFVEWLDAHFAGELDHLLRSDYDYVKARVLTGRPTTFVSHAWNGKFRDLMYLPHNLLGNHRSLKSNLAYWIDLFSINQSENRREIRAEEIRKIEHIIKGCKETILILDEDAVALSRIWCVYEIWHTLKANIELKIIFGSPNGLWKVLYALCTLAGRFVHLDIIDTESSRPSDKVEILASIKASGVSYMHVNSAVQKALEDSARVEISERAHVPVEIMERAVDLIREIGCTRVLEQGSEREKVFAVFGEHVKYN